MVFGITPADLQTLKVSVPAVALRLCGIRRVPPALPESAAVLACRQRILGLSKSVTFNHVLLFVTSFGVLSQLLLIRTPFVTVT